MRRSLALFLILTLIIFSAFSLIIHYSQFPYDKVEVYRGVVTLEAGKTTYLSLPKLNQKDRVLINLQTTAVIEMTALQDGEPTCVMPLVVEGARYCLVDYLLTNQKGFFIAKEGNANYLALHAPFPLIPYHVIFPLEGFAIDGAEEGGELSISLTKTGEDEMLNVTIIGKDETRTYSAMLVYPIDMIVHEDFRVMTKVSLNSSRGNAAVNFNVMSDTDNVLYSYEILRRRTAGSARTDFELKVTSQELMGRGGILGDKTSSVGVSIVLGPQGGRASVLLGDLEIQNAGKRGVVEIGASYSYQVPYEIYVAHKYSPSVTAVIFWLLLSAGVVAAWRLIGDGAPLGNRDAFRWFAKCHICLRDKFSVLLPSLKGLSGAFGTSALRFSLTLDIKGRIAR